MFTPEGYEPPKSSSNYLKFADGDNLIRILSPEPVMGWIDWIDKKPVRTPYADPKPEANDPKKPVKHFWAFSVWDYKDSRVKILEITQSTIQEAIYNLDTDPDWGEPMDYDIKINKTGKDLETKYNVNPKPKKPITKEIADTFKEINPDLNELFSNGDPFAKKDDVAMGERDELKPENINF